MNGIPNPNDFDVTGFNPEETSPFSYRRMMIYCSCMSYSTKKIDAPTFSPLYGEYSEGYIVALNTVYIGDYRKNMRLSTINYIIQNIELDEDGYVESIELALEKDNKFGNKRQFYPQNQKLKSNGIDLNTSWNYYTSEGFDTFTFISVPTKSFSGYFQGSMKDN